MKQLDIDTDDLLVVSLDLVELLGDVLTIVLGYLDVTALDDNVHA
jgi:hypothetical protein